MTTVNNSTYTSFQMLKSLDLNGDGKATKTEAEFFKKLGELSKKEGGSTITEIEDLLKTLPPKERDAAQTLLQSLSGGRLYFTNGKVDMFEETKGNFKTKRNEIDLNTKIPLDMTKIPDNGQGKKTGDIAALAEDVLDGNNTIKGVDQKVADLFLGNKRDSITGSLFDPNGFNFVVKQKQHTAGTSKSKADYNIIDSSKNYLPPETITKLKDELKAQTDKDGKTFSKFLEENNINIDDLKAGDIDKIKNFVKNLPPQNRAGFVEKFMTSLFVHNGDGIEDTNVNKNNFEKMISALPKDSLSGRKQIDCTYFAAISQKLTEGSSTNTAIVYRADSGLHDALVSIDAANKIYTVTSNEKVFNVSIDDLKKIKGDFWNGDPPPTAEEVGRAAAGKISKEQFEAPLNYVGERITAASASAPSTADPFSFNYKWSKETLSPGDSFEFRSNGPTDPKKSLNGKKLTVVDPADYPPNLPANQRPGSNEVLVKYLDDKKDSGGNIIFDSKGESVKEEKYAKISKDIYSENVKPGTKVPDLEKMDPKAAMTLLKGMDTETAYRTLNGLKDETLIKILNAGTKSHDADTQNIIEKFFDKNPEKAIDILKKMSPKDAGDVLSLVSSEKSAKIFSKIAESDMGAAAKIAGSMLNSAGSNMLAKMSPKQQAEILRKLKPEEAGKILQTMYDKAKTVLTDKDGLSAQETADIIKTMKPRNAGSVLMHLPNEKLNEVLGKFPPAQRKVLEEETKKMKANPVCLVD